MSYILDALKKAEQGRNQGKVPALFAVQAAESRTAHKPMWPWLVVGALAVNGAALFYWLQKSRSGASPVEVVQSSQPVQSVSAPISSPPENQSSASAARVQTEPTSKHSLPRVNAPRGTTTSANSPGNKQEAERMAKHVVEMRKNVSVDTSAATTIPAPATSGRGEPVQVQRIPQLTELPSGIQQEIPKLVVAMHMYSDKSSNRLVSINDKPLHEGDDVSPGLKLVEIMPDGIVFSYKGYRFKKGIN
jgi:general secretion pathway protein B